MALVNLNTYVLMFRKNVYSLPVINVIPTFVHHNKLSNMYLF
jgi:hypothetical protein